MKGREREIKAEMMKKKKEGIKEVASKRVEKVKKQERPNERIKEIDKIE